MEKESRMSKKTVENVCEYLRTGKVSAKKKKSCKKCKQQIFARIKEELGEMLLKELEENRKNDYKYGEQNVMQLSFAIETIERIESEV